MATTDELIWLNGEVMPLSQARVGVEDRGFQFADGVYEALRIYQGRIFTLRPHLDRLWRSASGIRLAMPVTKEQLADEMKRLAGRSGIQEGWIYLQVTRGVCQRNHLFPESCRPTLLFYVRGLKTLPEPERVPGVSLHSVPDERWKRCWIKSIALLPNVLAKNAAYAAGADEAVFVEDGIVSEGSASNLFAVIGGRLVTHPLTNKVLPGVTRDVILDVAPRVGVAVEERPMREQEALAADEVFIASTTRELVWVSRWGSRTWTGPGPVTLKLHHAFRDRVREESEMSA